MFGIKHVLFSVDDVMHMVLSFLHVEQRCYWMRTAQDDATINDLLRHETNVTPETAIAFSARSDPTFFATMMNQDWFYELLQTTTFGLDLWKQSSIANFRLLVPYLNQIILERDVMAYYHDVTPDHTKLKLLLDANPNLPLDQIFAGTSDATKLWLLQQTTTLSPNLLSKSISLNSSSDLIRFWIQHGEFGHSFRWSAKSISNHPISVLTILREAGCLLRVDDAIYFYHAFCDGHLETAQFFYNQSMDLNVYFWDAPLQYPQLFEYFFPKCDVSAATCLQMLRNVKPRCFHLTPQIFDVWFRMSTTQQHTVFEIINESVSLGNIVLLTYLARLHQSLFRKWLEVLAEFHISILPCVSLQFLWTTFRHANTKFLITGLSIHNQHETLMYVLQHNIISKKHQCNLIASLTTIHIDALCVLWTDNDLRSKLNVAVLLEDAIDRTNKDVAVFLFDQKVSLPHNLLATLAHKLCKMGLVDVLSTLNDVDDIEKCYFSLNTPFGMDVLPVLWRIAPLSRQQLIANELFWRIVKTNIEVAVFVWQQNVVAFDDITTILLTLYPKYTREEHNFFTQIHYSFF